jgi:hypothetical protein
MKPPKKMNVKGVSGRRVRDPITLVVVPVDETTEVPVNSYWLRKVRDGDIVEVGAQSKAKPKQQKGKE